jgi:hypothetical protein
MTDTHATGERVNKIAKEANKRIVSRTRWRVLDESSNIFFDSRNQLSLLSVFVLRTFLNVE